MGILWDKKIINALNYYSSLKVIPNDNIYIIDIGANVGWYTLFLAKCGYQIISFEASVVNNYILRKNLCLNQNLNITLINKGLFTEEKNVIIIIIEVILEMEWFNAIKIVNH